jgi:3-hydroxyisobutyrate dehydrogenase-like beta-hydroxyacid dehydrogenase
MLRRKDGTIMKIAMLGLGLMGSALAKALLAAGHEVVVWNRSAARAEPLRAAGASVAPRASEAARDASIVVVCVTDYAATHLALEDVPLQGKLLLQLSTGIPQEARATERWARSRGADYLDGAIMAVPRQIGKPESTILLSGPLAAYQRGADALSNLAGTLPHVGTDAGAASALDLALLSYFFGGLMGLYHGARICEAEGLSVEHYGQLLLGSVPALGAMVASDATNIQAGNYEAEDATLDICARSLDLIVRHADEAGLDRQVPQALATFFDRGRAAGLGHEGPAALVKVLRGSRAS